MNDITSEVTSKICTKCGRILPAHPLYFHKRKKCVMGLDASCKKCEKRRMQLYNVKYRKDNKKTISERKRQYNKNNKEKISERKKQYYQANKEVISAKSKKYYQANKECIIERITNYCEKNKEKVSERRRRYRKNNKEKFSERDRAYIQTENGRLVVRRRNHKRRVLKFQGTYEVFDSVEIFERDGYRCQICGKKTRPDYKNPNHPLYPNLDHIIPLVRGGDHTRENTQCLCHQCNMEKGSNYEGESFKLPVCK